MTKKANEPAETKQFEYMDPYTVEEFVNNFDREYDEYERLCGERRKEFSQYLGEFETDLIASGLKDPTIDKHYSNLDFYLNTYLLREAPLDVRAGCYRIDDFLGNFFIRKCMWSTPESIKSNCASFKKFYKSMLEHGRVSQSDYDYVCFTIKEDKQYWCDLCAEFNDPYAENPFSPFPSSLPFGGGFQDAIASNPFASGLNDYTELSQDEREAIADTAREIIGTLEAQGMTREEILDALEVVIEQFDHEAEMYDMPDEELLEIVTDLGIKTDRESLMNTMRTSVSEPEAADAVCYDAHVELDDLSYDELVVAIEILWARWLPEEPSDTVFLTHMMGGYYLPEDEPEGVAKEIALQEWQAAWNALKRIVRVGGLNTLPFDEPVADSHTVSDWIADYGSVLEAAAQQSHAAKEAYERFTSERDEMLGK